MSPEDIYGAWLTSRGGRLEGPVNEDRSLGLVGWHLFGHGPQFDDRAAVRAGTILTLQGGEGWRETLETMNAEEVARVVVWLKGKATLSAASGPGPDADIQPPTITCLPDGSRRFQAWIGEPPQFEPVRFTLTVPAEGAATAKWGPDAPESASDLEIQALIRDLSAKTPDRRLLALESLHAIEDDEATQAISLALRDADGEIRSRAVELLEEREGAVSVSALAKALTYEPDRLIRIEIVHALAELGGSAATAAIQKAATDDADEYVRDVAKSK
jgi:hypothetical protein